MYRWSDGGTATSPTFSEKHGTAPPTVGNERASFRRKVEAEAFLATIEADKLRGEWTDPRRARITIGEWNTQVQQSRVNLAASTRESDGSVIRSLILPTFGAASLSSIEPDHIRTWVADLVAAGYSPSTIRRAFTLLQLALEMAVDRGRLARSVDGGSYEISPDTAETLTAPDVYSLAEAPLARYRNNGEFVMELSAYHHLWQLSTPGGTVAELFKDGLLVGRPFSISSVIDAHCDINVAATADNAVIVYGDFSGYFWVDRVGMAVMPPVLLQNSGNMRFDATYGVYCFWRAGGDILIDGSLAVLNVATTA